MSKITQKTVDLTDTCDAAMRDVAFGEGLIARKDTPEEVLLPLIATKEAIDRALAACKNQSPEKGLKHRKIKIDERIEQTEEALLPPMPPLPTDIKLGRKSANLS